MMTLANPSIPPNPDGMVRKKDTDVIALWLRLNGRTVL